MAERISEAIRVFKRAVKYDDILRLFGAKRKRLVPWIFVSHKGIEHGQADGAGSLVAQIDRILCCAPQELKELIARDNMCSAIRWVI